MDTASISLLASSSISLLAPYLKLLGEEAVKEIGKNIGAQTSQTAWEKAQKLHELIKSKLSAKPDTAKVLTDLEKSPSDEDIQATIRYYLKETIATDEAFAKQIAAILRDAVEAGADNVFQTTIMGNVQKLVQMGNVYGDVKI